MRVEHDFLGEVKIPKNALYGIHSFRAQQNFPLQEKFSIEWYCAVGKVKHACYLTCKDFYTALKTKFPDNKFPIKIIPAKKLDFLIQAATEVSNGYFFDDFIVPAVQGGAGTSINMNINEIITNRALILSGSFPGNYDYIHPIEDANIYQSTNDVIPTALRVALLGLLEKLEEKINKVRLQTEVLEKSTRNFIRMAYTQMQQAVPSSFGLLFSSYNEAFSRDWMRVSKAFERIKTVNLGGSAAGTTLTVPRFFVMTAVKKLQELTKLSIAQSENLHDSTSNLDSLVETHGVLKAHAVNLEKVVSDIRLLASDIIAKPLLKIQARQAGSSIMPGKVNPVISEFIITVAHKIYASDILISTLSAQGCLDLNAYLPQIGNELIQTLKRLIAANKTLAINLLANLVVNNSIAKNEFLRSANAATALLPHIGYEKAGLLAREIKNTSCTIFEANNKLQLIDLQQLVKIMQPENLLKAGFTISDFA